MSAIAKRPLDRQLSAGATLQDDPLAAFTSAQADVERMWPAAQAVGPELRRPGFFGPGIVVYGPEVPVTADAPLQDRLLGLIGRDPAGRLNG